jgi:hypothetical protein
MAGCSRRLKPVKLVRLIAMVAVVAAICAPAAGATDLPKTYAFTSSAVAVKQAQVRKFAPAAVCKGKVPVDLIGGGRGYLVILCVDELNGPITIRFRVRNDGHIITEYLGW